MSLLRELRPAVAGVMVAALSLGCVHPATTRDDRWRWNDAYFHEEPDVICHVHHVQTVPKEVPVADGMCLREDASYSQALFSRFPNSFWSVYSCSCESWGARTVIRWVCPECRKEERFWRLAHDWPTEP